MKIYSVHDKEFAPYGRVLTGYDTAPLAAALENETPLPEAVEYLASAPALERLEIAEKIRLNAFGGMPIQMGYTNGHNRKLNCLEYHKASEVNFGSRDFIMLLALEGDIVDWKIDTSKVMAFLCPANTLVEVYATALHYAPCGAATGAGFKMLVALPLGTNTEKPEITPVNFEDSIMTAKNKWLLAHADSVEASEGAYVGLTGENIDLDKM